MVRGRSKLKRGYFNRFDSPNIENIVGKGESTG